MEMELKRKNIIEAFREYGTGLSAFVKSRVRSDDDAEDILQEVWYQLSNQPDTDAIESISGWLYSVARNKIIDRARKKKNSGIVDLLIDKETGEALLPPILFTKQHQPETEFMQGVFWEELFEALDELPENQQQVFVWNVLEGMTLQQIADTEGLNIKTVISRKRYAIQHLRNRLEFIYDELINS